MTAWRSLLGVACFGVVLAGASGCSPSLPTETDTASSLVLGHLDAGGPGAGATELDDEPSDETSLLAPLAGEGSGSTDDDDDGVSDTWFWAGVGAGAVTVAVVVIAVVVVVNKDKEGETILPDPSLGRIDF
jgi:hypothetical protein